MTVVLRGSSGPLRSSASFLVSACLHGWLLAWVAFGPQIASEDRPRTTYDALIKPHEDRVVWYNLREKLPEVAPAPDSAEARPPRAVKKFDQNLVVGDKEEDRPPQLISVPAPEIESPKLAELPNVVAAARVRAVRPFVGPPATPAAPAKLIFPDAPRVPLPTDMASIPIATETPRAPLRPFTPPPDKKAPATQPSLPDAPAVAAPAQAGASPIVGAPRAPLRPFTPPLDARRTAAGPSLPLPDAPSLPGKVETAGLAAGAPVPRPQPRAFRPPPGNAPAHGATATLPSAPSVAMSAPEGAPAAINALPRTFVAPPDRPRANAAAAPALPDSAPPIDASPAADGDGDSAMAIVGLKPSKTTDFPMPPNAQRAGFAAGPQPRPEGATGGSKAAAIVVPGLLARGGAKDVQPTLVASIAPTSRENLAAAARLARQTPPPPPPEAHVPAEPHATRVSSAPDPRLDGRAIYTTAIQMPNVTSYSGSWIVWFAEREAPPDSAAVELRPPVAVRKVDPKYIAAAADEHVEGKVLLSAVIRKDGTVDSVSLLNKLDDRLERSAAEALAKWEFEPAQRSGSPVDVDAVFEIPFHLAPRPAR